LGPELTWMIYGEIGRFETIVVVEVVVVVAAAVAATAATEREQE